MINELLSLTEGKTLEFKRDLSSPKPLLKTLVAFANSAGGHVMIGIGDDKEIIGVSQPLDEEERLCNLIADSISPRLVPNIEMLTVEGKTLLSVEVYPSGQRPHFINAEGAELGVYVRLGSATGSEAESGAQSGAQSELILHTLSDAPLAAAELIAVLKLSSKTGAFKRSIQELLAQAMIEYTIPEKPNSRLQKYRITAIGQQALREIK